MRLNSSPSSSHCSSPTSALRKNFDPIEHVRRSFVCRIGRRAPLAVLTLISGLSSVSLAITLLGTGIHGLTGSTSICIFDFSQDTIGWKSPFLSWHEVVFVRVIVYWSCTHRSFIPHRFGESRSEIRWMHSFAFRATGLAIGLTGEIVSKILVEVLLYVSSS